MKRVNTGSGNVPELQVGDLVYWQSSSAGHTKQKVGAIVAIVPAGDVPDDVARKVFGDNWRKTYAQEFNRYARYALRTEPSYLVAVAAETYVGASNGHKPALYWPVAARLRLLTFESNPFAFTNPVYAWTRNAAAEAAKRVGRVNVKFDKFVSTDLDGTKHVAGPHTVDPAPVPAPVPVASPAGAGLPDDKAGFIGLRPAWAIDEEDSD